MTAPKAWTRREFLRGSLMTAGALSARSTLGLLA